MKRGVLAGDIDVRVKSAGVKSRIAIGRLGSFEPEQAFIGDRYKIIPLELLLLTETVGLKGLRSFAAAF